MAGWYTRPVVFVRDLEVSRAFYVERLGFVPSWAHEEEGRLRVAQVARDDCEVILAVDPERAGGARLFVSLEPDELAVLEAEIAETPIDVTRAWWGSPVIRIEDPDGNELLVPVEGA